MRKHTVLFFSFCIVVSFLIGLLSFPGSASAESSLNNDVTLERISTATRSDGLGYVLRFHFTAAPDSFKVVQSSAELIQIAFYNRGIVHETEQIAYHGPITALERTNLYNGLGVDITLNPETSYRAQAYLDQNRRHVLIGLTEVSSREINVLTDGVEPVMWNGNIAAAGDEFIEADTTLSDSELEELLAVDNDDFWPESGPLTPAEINRSAITFDTIILDAGHGGQDPGSIGAAGNYEKDIALAVTKKVGEYINQYLPELRVEFTRTDDTFIGLAERGRIANRKNGNLFVSIHTNAHTGRQANGAEFYFLGQGRSASALEVMRRENSVVRFEQEADEVEELTQQQLMIYELQNAGNMAMSQHFAELLNHQFSQRAQRRSRGVKQAGLQVLWEASMPGVLIELGFISNPTEERFMMSEYGQSILASAIFRAIRDYKESFERASRDRNNND
ncbi:MAG: N-acetylmuramoyl-L-alanine amidase [Balneolia bacterium]|nr:N-acetylmuramoyl-L-alanine amidase [Balneolia bacterium]